MTPKPSWKRDVGRNLKQLQFEIVVFDSWKCSVAKGIMATTDDSAIRESWKVKDHAEIWSQSAQKWFAGEIVRYILIVYREPYVMWWQI